MKCRDYWRLTRRYLEMRKRPVLLLGPSLEAVSGVSTHLNQLFGSSLSGVVQLSHFRVGSEGGNESRWGKVLRLVYSPFALFARLLIHRPRIVHINTSLDTKAYWRDLAYLIAARTLGRKVVYQVHGGALPLAFCGGNSWFCRFLRWSLSLPQVVVLLAQEELRAYRQFVPAMRVIVVPNAIDTERLIGVTRSPPVNRALQLMFLGRLVETKGVFELIECIKLLRAENIPLHLLVVGTGPAEGQIRELVTVGGLSDYVTLHGAAFGAAKHRLW
jgi:glycosyltransferase involved in cell wall biosynthesis